MDAFHLYPLNGRLEYLDGRLAQHSLVGGGLYRDGSRAGRAARAEEHQNRD